MLVGYLVPAPGVELDLAACRAALRSQLPAALVPLLATVDALPTRGSGKVDRDALPWPLERMADEERRAVPAGDGGVAGRAVDPQPSGSR